MSARTATVSAPPRTGLPLPTPGFDPLEVVGDPARTGRTPGEGRRGHRAERHRAPRSPRCGTRSYADRSLCALSPAPPLPSDARCGFASVRCRFSTTSDRLSHSRVDFGGHVTAKYAQGPWCAACLTRPPVRHGLDTMRAMDAAPSGSSSVAEAGPVAPARPGESTRPIEDGEAGRPHLLGGGSKGTEERAGAADGPRPPVAATRSRGAAVRRTDGPPVRDRHRGDPRRGPCPPLLDEVGPLARRGADRQYRRPAAPRLAVAPPPRRGPSALLRPAPFLDGRFGTSDLAVRALPGVIGVATVPLA